MPGEVWTADWWQALPSGIHPPPYAPPHRYYSLFPTQVGAAAHEALGSTGGGNTGGGLHNGEGGAHTVGGAGELGRDGNTEGGAGPPVLQLTMGEERAAAAVKGGGSGVNGGGDVKGGASDVNGTISGTGAFPPLAKHPSNGQSPTSPLGPFSTATSVEGANNGQPPIPETLTSAGGGNRAPSGAGPPSLTVGTPCGSGGGSSAGGAPSLLARPASSLPLTLLRPPFSDCGEEVRNSDF